MDPALSFVFIRGVLSGALTATTLESLATPAVRGFLVRRQVDGLLAYAGVANEPWQALYRRVWEFQLEHLGELLGELAQSGIDAIVLKSAELVNRYYKDVPLGFCVDADVLVRREQVQAAKAVLFGLGYQQSYFDTAKFGLVPIDVQQVGRVEASHYELAPFRLVKIQECPSEYLSGFAEQSGPAYLCGTKLALVMEIDLHHNVALDTSPQQLFDRAVPSSTFRAQTLSTADHLWVNCSRFYNETALFGKRTLRPLVYTSPLLREVVDWNVVMEAARSLELSASLYYPLRIIEKLMSTVVPTEVLDMVNPRLAGSERDFGWQLGPLFETVDPFPFESSLELDNGSACPC